jgi:hypothetical protein
MRPARSAQRRLKAMRDHSERSETLAEDLSGPPFGCMEAVRAVASG